MREIVFTVITEHFYFCGRNKNMNSGKRTSSVCEYKMEIDFFCVIFVELGMLMSHGLSTYDADSHKN